jgi:hypothetical protein
LGPVGQQVARKKTKQQRLADERVREGKNSLAEKSEGKRRNTGEESADRRKAERPIFSGEERAAALPAVAAQEMGGGMERRRDLFARGPCTYIYSSC